MRRFLLVLLAANLAVAAWLLLGEPVDVVREPERLNLQIDPGRFHVLTEGGLARLRSQAERNRAAAAAAPPAPAPKIDVPAASCVEIGVFASDAAAKKARSRLAAVGLAERTSTVTADQGVRLRVTGVDAAAEAKIQSILKDFPKQELAHCIEVPAAH